MQPIHQNTPFKKKLHLIEREMITSQTWKESLTTGRAGLEIPRLCPCRAITVNPELDEARVQFQKLKFQIFFRHPDGDLNLDEIKNTLRLLSVNGETNLMNLIML